MDVFGSSNPVAPLLRASIHAGVKISVIEHDGIRIEHMTHSGATAIGQDGAEELPVTVKPLYLILRGQELREKMKAKFTCLLLVQCIQNF